MAAVLDYPKPEAACVWSILDLTESSGSRGSEGRQVHEEARDVARRWRERAEILLAVADDEDGEIAYVPPPPNRTFFVKTRYVFLGRGKPLRFDLEDE